MTFAEPGGDKLPNDPLFYTEAVDPGLGGNGKVILKILFFAAINPCALNETGLPFIPGHRADFACRDSDRERIFSGAPEGDPHGFSLVHWQHKSAVLQPFLRNPAFIVFDVFEFKPV